MSVPDKTIVLLHDEAQELIVSDPEILLGAPVYRGTRIPVALVADMLAQGAGVDEVLEGNLALDRDMVELAPLYMRAFPHRGRASRVPWAVQKPVRVTRHVRALEALSCSGFAEISAQNSYEISSRN